MDFTLRVYNKLLKTLIDQGFSFLTFEESLTYSTEKSVILRHDVDALPENSLSFAKIESALGLKGSYYFRIVPESFSKDIIKEIDALGHEIGYHYEDLSGCAVRGVRYEEEDLARIAIESFKKNLEKLRQITPVKTICMHGSPISKWDSRLLWKYYDYHDFGISGEPYFDVDFGEVIYLTDTGRRWDGEAVSVRDKVQGAGRRAQCKNQFSEWKVKPFKYLEKRSDLKPRTHNLLPATALKFHSTSDIIKAADNGFLPHKLMMTFHPQRWTDQPVLWIKEFVWQNVKNVIKYFFVRVRD
jgi:hypothetical protein